MLLLRKIGLGLVLIVLAGCVLSYEQLTIQETIAQERADVRFMAKGFAGDSMIVTMKGKVNKPTSVTIPHGMILSNRNKRQDLVAVRYMGIAQSIDSEKYSSGHEERLTAEKKQTVHFVLEIYSITFNKPWIKKDDQFIINGMAEGDLMQFVEFSANQKEGNYFPKQLAFWAITDDIDQETILEYYPETSINDFAIAENFIIEAGLHPEDYLMFTEE